MLSRDIPLFKLDLTGKNPDNFMSQEYYRRTDTENDIVFVMRSGPFYTASLILTTPEGTTLVEDEDYEIFGIASALTAFAQNKEVGMMIKLLNSKVTEWFADYQVMGHFSILNQDLVNLIEGAVNDDRPVYYRNLRNIPTHFDPKLHQHDIRYDIHSFSDLIDIIQRIPEIKKQRKDTTLFSVEQFYETLTFHIETYESMLLGYISKHDSDNADPLTNSHGLTAKQVGLENVDNFATASLLDTLDGFRQDMHLTVDNVQKVMKQQQDASKTLYPFGILPILRYGNNSFIPNPIQGSYEGMGGNDFKMGFNIEPNNELLGLCNRTDGRVNALYFIRGVNNAENNTTFMDVENLSYTAYQYTHQTADNDGVKLRYILRGSDGKFLLIGGLDTNTNETVWYYTLGNGTFDPLKHVLKKMPDDIPIKVTNLLFTGGFPNYILMFARQAPVSNANGLGAEYRNVVYETPTDAATFEGVSFDSGFVGYWAYEYSVSEDKWRKIGFNYTQCGRSEQITSRLWAPYKTVIEEVSVTRPRADGKDYKYGLGACQYYFSSLITQWYTRNWQECCLGFYDTETQKSYLKFENVSYGQDARSGNHEGGTYSLNIVLSDRNIIDDIVYYTIENRRGLATQYKYDTTIINKGPSTAVYDFEGNLVNAPYSDWAPQGASGDRTLAIVNNRYYISIGSNSYGTFPASISMLDLQSQENIVDYNLWVDDRIDNGKATNVHKESSTKTYNERNPINLSIGFHSVFWTQLDPNDVETFGSIGYGHDGITNHLVYRKQKILKSNGTPNPPDKVYPLFDTRNVLGYELDNTVFNIDNKPFLPFCTNIFYDATDNRRKDYLTHLVGHESFKDTSNNVSNSTASTDFRIEWEVQSSSSGDTYTFVPVKTIDLSDAITNILIPKIIEGSKTLYPNDDISLENALACHRISFTHLRSNKYENLLIFATLGFNNTNTYSYAFGVAFNLSNDNTVTVVGDVKGHVWNGSVRSGYIETYRKEGQTFGRSVDPSNTQARDVIKQLENGMSFVNMQWNLQINVNNNISKNGSSFLISENGIEGMASHTQYWTAGQYYIFHHPYYGLLSRNASGIAPGAVQVGQPYKDNPSTIGEALSAGSKEDVMGIANYIESGFSIVFGAVSSIMFNGQSYNLSGLVKDLNEVTSNPRNKTFYVYLDYGEQGPYYNVTLSPIAESASRAMLAMVKTNDDSIYEIINYNVFTMGGVRISIQKQGSVIPAATGSIYESGQIQGWVTTHRS